MLNADGVCNNKIPIVENEDATLGLPIALLDADHVAVVTHFIDTWRLYLPLRPSFI